ncbi:MAG: argininosuccinate synthase [Candidatus Aenigmarchaeota archaeon]|nr:argininosuccinate synthase [Candidatus Aenigmarchaeota archaeon]
MKNKLESIDVSKTYHKSDYEAEHSCVNDCLLLYSGGLDTSCILCWLQKKYKCNVTTLTVNVGQRWDDLKEIEKKAYTLGAKKHYTIDAEEELINDYCSKAIKANATIDNGHPISSSLTRPLIAKIAVQIMKKDKITIFAHGASGKSNDSLRFDNSILTLLPKAKIIAPVRTWSFDRNDELAYAKQNNIAVKATKKNPYSVDDNIWAIEIESGILDDIAEKTPDNIYKLSNPNKTTQTAEYIEIEFKKGIPIALNKKKQTLKEIVEQLNKIGSKYCIGLYDCLEERGVGCKVRELHEAPAASILIMAHKELEQLVLTKNILRVKKQIDSEWLDAALNGFWFSRQFDTLNAYIDEANQYVSGTIKIRLTKEKISIISRSSEFALDYANLMNNNYNINQQLTSSFIQVNGLEERAAYNMLNKQ